MVVKCKLYYYEFKVLQTTQVYRYTELAEVIPHFNEDTIPVEHRPCTPSILPSEACVYTGIRLKHTNSLLCNTHYNTTMATGKLGTIQCIPYKTYIRTDTYPPYKCILSLHSYHLLCGIFLNS